jgi:hypothetical protein
MTTRTITGARWTDATRATFVALVDGVQTFCPADRAALWGVTPAAEWSHVTAARWESGDYAAIIVTCADGSTRRATAAEEAAIEAQAALTVGPPLLDDEKARHCDTLNARRNAVIFSPIGLDILVDDGAGGTTTETLIFDADPSAQANIQAAVTDSLLMRAQGGDPATYEISWILSDNSTISPALGDAGALYLADMESLGQAIKQRSSTEYIKCRARKDRVRAAADMDELSEAMAAILTEIAAE